MIFHWCSYLDPTVFQLSVSRPRPRHRLPPSRVGRDTGTNSSAPKAEEGFRETVCLGCDWKQETPERSDIC